MDPISSFAAGVNSSIKILDLTYQLKAVDEQTADLLNTTAHVNTNVNEARRLRRLKDGLIGNDERIWMDRVIDDTEKALRDVAQLIEPARVDKETKQSVNTWNRFLWVFRDSPKVRDKHGRLHMCHQTLTTVIASLYNKDLVVIAPMTKEENEAQPPPYDLEMEALFNWQTHRKRSKSRANLRSPGLTANLSSEPNSTMANVHDNARSVKEFLDRSSMNATYIPMPEYSEFLKPHLTSSSFETFPSAITSAKESHASGLGIKVEQQDQATYQAYQPPSAWNDQTLIPKLQPQMSVTELPSSIMTPPLLHSYNNFENLNAIHNDFRSPSVPSHYNPVNGSPDATTEERKPIRTIKGGGGRGWLAYHATRSPTDDFMD
ncbi:MAG: hypothetical protein Q9190_006983 [Brigantiaea leucoxantha]